MPNTQLQYRFCWVLVARIVDSNVCSSPCATNYLKLGKGSSTFNVKAFTLYKKLGKNGTT